MILNKSNFCRKISHESPQRLMKLICAGSFRVGVVNLMMAGLEDFIQGS